MDRPCKIGLIFLFGFGGTILTGNTYKGGELRTLASYTYGRFEVRMKASVGDGIISSFFTYHDFTGSADQWNEIDIEFPGNQPEAVQFNTITAYQAQQVYLQNLSFAPSDSFHVYAFEWTPSYVAWFVDGDEVYQQTGSHIQALDKAQKIMMNIWPPDYAGWVGTLDPDDLSVYAYYDWVKYYLYVPGTGNTGTDNNFILYWSDDFDYWDLNRWEKGNHTFYGNLADFIPANVVFLDGYMVLCLTTASNIGYTGDPLGVVSQPSLPADYTLGSAYPNPFNASLTIPLFIPNESKVRIDVFDISGRLIRTLVKEQFSAGDYTFHWNAGDRPSGMYILDCQVNRERYHQKVLLLK